MAANNGTARPLDELQALLATARDLAKTLSEDPQLERLLRAFRAFPERDREAILQVIEKDASWRRIVAETDDTTGISVRPNPHASLYVHVIDPPAGLPLDAATAARDADVIRRGVETLVGLIPLLLQEAVHEQWTAAARDIAARAEPEVRAHVLRLVHEVERIVAAARD